VSFSLCFGLGSLKHISVLGFPSHKGSLSNTRKAHPSSTRIPLASSTVDKLSQLDPTKYDSICYSFDRKEKKDHGEGGGIVGAPLKGKRVLIVDDVVTAGTAKREAIAKIRQEGGVVVGIGEFVLFIWGG